MTLEEELASEIEEPVAAPVKPPRKPFMLAQLLRAIGLLLLIWSFLEVAWFWRSNFALVHREDAPFGVFSSLFTSDWSFSLRNSPVPQFLASLLMMALTTVLGMVVFRAFDAFLRPRVQVALGFAVGLGVSGIAFELLTMAKLLYLPLAWLMWGFLFWLFCGGIIFRRSRPVMRWWRKPPAGDPRLVPFLDEKHKGARRYLTVRAPRKEELYPTGVFERWFCRVAFAMIAIMTLAIYWHAVFFPETYWDSLILYLGYGRMTFLEHAFPFKAVAQVGIGLGANYPHLFSNYGAVASTMFGGWSDLYQRMAAPTAGTLSVILVYDTILFMWGRRGVAMAGALLFRCVPLGIAYSTYASDYAIAILFTAAFLFLVALFARTRLPGVFVLLTFIPAAAMHVNYLMGVLWVPWMLAVVLAVRGRKRRLPEDQLPDQEDVLAMPRYFQPDAEEEDESAEPLEMELHAADEPGLRPVLASKFFWITFAACVVLGSTWYVRNYALTGNPVYSFFPQIFTKSININPEVLESADVEWFLNGDGIGRTAEFYADIEAGRPSDENPDTFERQASLRHRIKSSFLYWQGFDPFRLNEDGTISNPKWIDRQYWLTLVMQPEPPESPSVDVNMFGQPLEMFRWRHNYKMAPLVLGFFLPGLIAGLMIWFFSRGALFANIQPYDRHVMTAVMWTALLTVGCFLGYHYFLADYYLYQILPMIVPMSILAAAPFVIWRSVDSRIEKVVEVFAYALLIAMAILPGVAMSLMNFKIHAPGVSFGQYYNPINLDNFRHPGMEPDIYYRIAFGEDPNMWDYLNTQALGSKILTHENRHYVIDPSITLIHLDDWEIQKTYGMAQDEDKMALFKELGIEYYLRVENESKHRINKRVGIDRLIREGYLAPVASDGPNELYRFRYDLE